MAWYSSVDVRVRGRLVEVSLRYGAFNGAKVVKGKPLDNLRVGKKYSRDLKRLLRALRHEERRNPGPFLPPDF